MEPGTKITYYKALNRADVVRYFYEKEDEYFHKNIHKLGGTVEENIKSTLDTVVPDTFYVVYVGVELAAFFTKFDGGDKEVLDGWHIAEEYRNATFIPEFWRIVKEVFSGEILAGLFEKNRPALEHLYRQGFVIQNKIETEEGNLVILTH